MTRSHVLKQKRQRRRAHRAQKAREPAPRVIYLGGFGRAFRFEVGCTVKAWQVDADGRTVREVAEPEPSVLWEQLGGPEALARLTS